MDFFMTIQEYQELLIVLSNLYRKDLLTEEQFEKERDRAWSLVEKTHKQ